MLVLVLERGKSEAIWSGVLVCCCRFLLPLASDHSLEFVKRTSDLRSPSLAHHLESGGVACVERKFNEGLIACFELLETHSHATGSKPRVTLYKSVQEVGRGHSPLTTTVVFAFVSTCMCRWWCLFVLRLNSF
jgi:hypothetical protein